MEPRESSALMRAATAAGLTPARVADVAACIDAIEVGEDSGVEVRSASAVGCFVIVVAGRGDVDHSFVAGHGEGLRRVSILADELVITSEQRPPRTELTMRFAVA